MKKFYSFLFAAVALVGFAACNSDSTEEPTPAGAEKLSFKANIDTTKTDLEGLQTIWCKGDVVMIDGFEFVCGDDLALFTCTQTGCTSLLNKEVEAVYSNKKDGKIDSEAGVHGALLKATGTLTTEGATFEFAVQNAFLKLTTTGTVTLKGAGLFSTGDELTIAEDGEHYVAINPAADVAFSCESKDMELKNKTITFNAKTIYNLGELTGLGDAHEMFGIVGAHQDWNTAAPDALYQIPNSNTYVRYNVTLAEGGFKFYGSKTETITVEHPAVTTGEEGDWYLIPNTNWKKDNARFAIYFFGDGDTWVSMKDENGDGIYVGNNPTDGKKYTSMIFCRMSPNAAANNWDNKWNQTGDLTIPKDGKNCFTVPSGSWNDATTSWSVHTPEVKEAWTEEVEEVYTYWIGYVADASGDYKTGWATSWSNNEGADITVADTSKTYDIYFSKGEDQDWDGTKGFEIYYTVLEHGSAAPELK